MTQNVGTTDRILRLGAGVLLIAIALFGGTAFLAGPAMTYGAVAVGAVLIATAVLRLCPLYSVFGIRTCRV